MILYTSGDILSDNANQAIVIPVNCVGVMGAGLAKKFKEKYPDQYKTYKYACQDKKIQIGKCFMVTATQLYTKLSKPYFIIYFPSKDHWKYPSKLSYIEDGLKDLHYISKTCYIFQIAIPKIGCGLGGLDWNDVSCLIEKYFKDDDEIKLTVYQQRRK